MFLSVSDWFRVTEGYSGSDLSSLAKDASLGPIRGQMQSSSQSLCRNIREGKGGAAAGEKTLI